MSAIYWLIERNSKHKNMPPNEPILWFRERSCFAQGDVDYWTPHADRARRFPSKESAEEYAKTFAGDDNYDPLPDVTEHMDCDGPRALPDKETPKFRPCPLCGSEALGVEHPPVKHFYPGSYSIKCPACKLGLLANTEELATAAWNSRVTLPDEQTARVEELERQLADLRCISNVNGDWSMKFSNMQERAETAERQLATARQDERERCAKVCEREASLWKSSRDIEPDDVAGAKGACANAAAAIRALPDETKSDLPLVKTSEPVPHRKQDREGRWG